MVFSFSKERLREAKHFLSFIFTLIFVVLIILFVLQRGASASEEGSTSNISTCEQVPAIEEVLRIQDILTSKSSDALIMANEGATLSSNTTASRVTMHRLYNRWTGEHFYTSDMTEKNSLVKASWTYEGVGWYAPYTSKTPVYRLYNPYVSGGDHHYTTSLSERATLKSAGWKDEGIGWYSTNEGEIDRVAIYRQYNPFAQTGTHHYTQSKSENDKLVKAGWKPEGAGWYGYSKLASSLRALDFSKIAVTLTTKTYNGKVQTQTITSSVYKVNTDYTVTYSNNKNAGTATIVVKGKGSYTGSKTYKFSITKALLTVKWGNTAFTYNGKSQAPTATLDGILGTDKVTPHVSGARTDWGEAYLATATIDNSNYQLTGVTTTKFSIGKLDISTAAVTLDEALTYTSENQIQPVSKVVIGDVELTEGIDFDISGNTGKMAGKYTTLTVAGKNNCVGTKKNVEFEIKKAPISVSWTNTAFTYDAAYHKPNATFSGTQGTDTIALTVSGEQANANAEGEQYVASASLDETSAINYEIAATTKTVKFTIEKANPTYTPRVLEGEMNKTLSTVTLSAPLPTDTPGSVAWADGKTAMSEQGEQTFKATFMPTDTKNYNVATVYVTVKVKKTTVYVTFNVTAPGNESVTIDGKSQNKVEKFLEYDDAAATPPIHKLTTANFPTVKITSANTEGYVFAGWATSSEATTGKKVYEMVGKIVSTDRQYYAVWATTKGFWLGTAGASADYVDEAYFKANDANYHSGAEIVSDMDVLHNSADSNYETVKKKWDTYYSDENVRLYATYKGGETETDNDGTTTSPLNKYVEFRILEVSGAEGHKLHDGKTSDGSVITFMATHVLPTAYSINSTNTNVGGWGESQLRKDLNYVDGEEGVIYKKFSTDFVYHVKTVTKEYNNGGSENSQTATPWSVGCKLWVPSYTELVDSSESGYASSLPKYEGTQYKWCKDNVKNISSDNARLKYTTRAVGTPGSSSSTNCLIWERSPSVSGVHYFGVITAGGDPSFSLNADSRYGVAPAFSF